MAAPAAAPFTAALDPGRDATVLTVNVPTGAASLNLWRISESGALAGVRSAYPRTGLPGSAVVLSIRDFEVPLDNAVEYYSQAFDAGGLGGPVSGPVAFEVSSTPGADDWLVDLVRSVNTLQVRIESLAELAYEQVQGVHHVLNRRTPVVTSDIAGTPTFELVFTTDHFPDARDVLRNMLGTGSPVLLRTAPDRGVGNMYLQPNSWKEARASRIAFEQTRRYVVAAVQVARPDPTLFRPIAPVSYSDMKTNYGTYANLHALGGSYDQVLYDYPAAGTGTIQMAPWPPMDV